jgi:pimeloyl-ACP methyl ester carboxylesterase
MADYRTNRDAAYLSRIQASVEEFASSYGLHWLINKRRTIFLFPGGVGSQLMRADQVDPNPAQFYEKVWLDGGIFGAGSPDAFPLALLPGSVDTEKRYIVADGCVNIPGPIPDLQPYANFSQWCHDHNIDLFIFAWDWRRSVLDAADFFLNIFLPMFDARFGGQTPHPLDHFTLVGHSAGGMVVKAILNSTTDQYVQRLKKAITVATPFYGYGGQISRYFHGVDFVDVRPSVSARIISSFPGPYEYLYVDHDTYHANKDAFANDPGGFNLAAYPSMDADDPAIVADPYDAQPDDSGMVRYPLHYGFESSLLYRAKVVARRISNAFADPSITEKFYTIRGVQSANGQVLNETAVSQSWARISPDFDPDNDPVPIVETKGPGDDTQPAWTTRVLWLPPNQVTTIVGDDIQHAIMMELPSVQKKIAELIGLDPAHMTFKQKNMGQLAASRSEFNDFLDGMRKVATDRDQPIDRRKALKSEFLRRFKPDELQRLLGRYYLDALKSPGQMTSRSQNPVRPNEL